MKTVRLFAVVITLTISVSGINAIIIPQILRSEPGWVATILAYALHYSLPAGRAWDSPITPPGAAEKRRNSRLDKLLLPRAPWNLANTERAEWGYWPIGIVDYANLLESAVNGDNTLHQHVQKNFNTRSSYDYREATIPERAWLDWLRVGSWTITAYGERRGMVGVSLVLLPRSNLAWFIISYVVVSLMAIMFLTTHTLRNHDVCRVLLVAMLSASVACCIESYAREVVWLALELTLRIANYGSPYPYLVNGVTLTAINVHYGYPIMKTGFEVICMFGGWFACRLTIVVAVCDYWLRRDHSRRSPGQVFCRSCEYELTSSAPLCPECGTSVGGPDGRSTTPRTFIRLFRWPPDTKRGRLIRRSIIALWWSFILFLIFAPLTFAWVCRFLWWVVGDEITKYPLP